MHLKEFDYQLHPEIIAPYPVSRRDNSRLMVLNRTIKAIENKKFFEISSYMKKEDALVLNDTRVVPARLYGKKGSGGKVEVLLLKQISEKDVIWECLIKTSKKVRVQSSIIFPESLKGEIVEKTGEGRWKIKFIGNKGNFYEVLDNIGEAPLPPYILKRREGVQEKKIDKERYQTIYAQKRGAIAAPTAGLHFTEQVLYDIRKIGVKLIWITLHVGGGTFFPPRVEEVSQHMMESEYFEITEEDAKIINQVKQKGGRVFSVGTTTTRALESSTDPEGILHPARGYTNLFIHPGYKFKMINCLITNFHQPRSTPLILVSAFTGLDFVKQAYRQAIDNNYRFLSYGDGMLIL